MTQSAPATPEAQIQQQRHLMRQLLVLPAEIREHRQRLARLQLAGADPTKAVQQLLVEVHATLMSCLQDAADGIVFLIGQLQVQQGSNTASFEDINQRLLTLEGGFAPDLDDEQIEQLVRLCGESQGCAQLLMQVGELDDAGKARASSLQALAQHVQAWLEELAGADEDDAEPPGGEVAGNAAAPAAAAEPAAAP